MSKQQIESALEKYKIIHPYLEKEVPLPQVAKHHNIGLRTLRKWVKAYRDEGLAGLDRKSRSDKDVRRYLTKDLEEMIEALALRKTPTTLAFIHRKIVEVAEEKNLKPPSYDIVAYFNENRPPALKLLGHLR